jgi:hypothetical protein
VNLRDVRLIYCLANHIKIDFPSLMISHLSDCIKKRCMVGYGGLLTCVFKKFGVPLDGLQFPMSANNKIGAKCLNNLHLKLNEKGILEDFVDEVEEVSFDEEKGEKEREEGGQEEKGEEREDEENKDREIVSSAHAEQAEEAQE